MATVLTEKKVLFCGIWKPSPRAAKDALLRQISTQFLTKKSLSSTYQLCTDGLRLLVNRENGKQGPKTKIPLSGIQDICVNKYNSTCVMTIYIDDERRLNYLVCRFESERDAAHLVTTFCDHKKCLNGEGYRIPLAKPQGVNWTLMPKQHNGMNGHSEMSSTGSTDDHDDGAGTMEAPRNGVHSSVTAEHHVKVDAAVNTFEREPCEVEGRPGFSVAVQTNFGEYDSDQQSMMSTTSFRSLKDELLTLSQEIRDIKFLLEKTTGVSTAEYFKRDMNDNNTFSNGVLGRRIHLPVDGQDLPSPTDSGNGNDKRVNFAANAVDVSDYDLRNFGVQTDKSQRKGYYVKHQGRSEGRAMHSVRGVPRQRSSSSNSMPRSPVSIGRNDVFDYTSTSGRAGLVRGSASHVRTGSTDTIERPIEQVYNVNTRNPRSARSKIMMMSSGHSTMPAMRRPQSNSRSSVND